MDGTEQINILLVDDQPAKLLSYEVILQPLGANILKANSGREALDLLLRNEIAVVLVDVFMPELDGFELAQMIREHPRFARTAIIFVSAVLLDDVDRLRGYEMGAVDYVPVPVIAEVLRAKVRVFVDLYRKTKALESLNSELERRVAERTAELQAALEHQTLLSREVDHRAKNALAVVQSIVRLTKAETVGEYVTALEGRLKAVSCAHQLLSKSRWEGADLRGLLAEELAPYGEDDTPRIVCQGPKVLLNPAMAQTLALALHELATNAAKYGALSTERGSVAIHWELARGQFTIVWTETGGPSTSAPARKGVGSRIIDASICGQLGGQADLDWRPEGLRCVLTIPHAGDIKADPSANGLRRGTAAKPGERAFTGECVLLVEDEPLVALMMQDMLQDFGFSIAGPYTRVADAAAALSEGAIKSAVLDVNLGGEFVYPIADLLTAGNIPFIFVTGYDSGGVDARFSGVPVLAKPVERQDLLRVLMAIMGRGGAASEEQAPLRPGLLRRSPFWEHLRPRLLGSLS